MAVAAVQPMLIDFVDQLSGTAAKDGRLLAEVRVDEEAASLAGCTVDEAFASLDDHFDTEVTDGGAGELH